MKTEIEAIKSEIQKPIFEEVKNTQSVEEMSSIKLLGELLGFLRKERMMSLLMLCRQISKIELQGKVAEIFSDDDEMLELQTNEKYRVEIVKFFESKGLSFKVHENEKIVSEVDELVRLLGKKLVIK